MNTVHEVTEKGDRNDEFDLHGKRGSYIRIMDRNAPDGAFASYCGIWYEPVHRIAYMEPVATDPDYRRMGLGRAAVLEGVRRCGVEGATVAYVGTGMHIYRSIGFRRMYKPGEHQVITGEKNNEWNCDRDDDRGLHPVALSTPGTVIAYYHRSPAL